MVTDFEELVGENADLRRQLEEARDDIDTYKGDLNEASHSLGVELLQPNLRGKLAGLVLAMNGHNADLQAEVERLRKTVEKRHDEIGELQLSKDRLREIVEEFAEPTMEICACRCHRCREYTMRARIYLMNIGACAVLTTEGGSDG